MKKLGASIIMVALISFESCNHKTPSETIGGRNSQLSISPSENRSALLEIKSYSEAIKAIKPLMHDSRETLDSGAAIFAVWAAKNMTWSDVKVKRNETSIPLVMKDSDEERGKRSCHFGRLIQISVAKTEQGKIAEGLLGVYGGGIVAFEAVGSSGQLVAGNFATICGIVTGLYDYSNSGGGVGHAVQIVGMFDIPQNRRSNSKREVSSTPNGGNSSQH